MALSEQEHKLTKALAECRRSNNVLAQQLHEALAEIAKRNQVMFTAEIAALDEWKPDEPALKAVS